MAPVLSWPLVKPFTPHVVLPERPRLSVRVPVEGTVAGLSASPNVMLTVSPTSTAPLRLVAEPAVADGAVVSYENTDGVDVTLPAVSVTADRRRVGDAVGERARRQRDVPGRRARGREVRRRGHPRRTAPEARVARPLEPDPHRGDARLRVGGGAAHAVGRAAARRPARGVVRAAVGGERRHSRRRGQVDADLRRGRLDRLRVPEGVDREVLDRVHAARGQRDRRALASTRPSAWSRRS